MAGFWSVIAPTLLATLAVATVTVSAMPPSSPAAELLGAAAGRSPVEAQTGDPAPADLPLSRLLNPLVERAVSRALQRRGAATDAEDGPQQRSLQLMQTKLDAVARVLSYVAGVVTAHGSGGCCPSAWQLPPPLAVLAEADEADATKPTAAGKQGPGGKLSVASDPKLAAAAVEEERDAPCESEPKPEVSGAAPFKEPVRRACARSCLQLRNQASAQLQDGVYWLTGLPVPVFCDFSLDGGGWTLLLTAISKDGWDVLAALGRNERSPSITDNYSILRHADTIRDLGKGARFAYRIEGLANVGRQRWGGVWLAPRSYTFVDTSASQPGVALVRKFDAWDYDTEYSLQNRMPWLNAAVRPGPSVLTTASTIGEWWGTLVTHDSYTHLNESPWIHPVRRSSGTVLYWMREETV